MGAYWDVPLSLSADLASVASSSGLSYHLLLQQNSGEPKCFGGDETDDVPIALLPGLCAKAAVSIKKSIDAWRKKEDKLKNVQPYDIFLSDSHISLTGIVGKCHFPFDVDNPFIPCIHLFGLWRFCCCSSDCFRNLFIDTPFISWISNLIIT